jgi:leucyl-tRNA synthetase
MSLYNHAAIWEDKNMLPRGFFCNGWILVNGKKMSKSEGNFLTIKTCIDKYGVDATRIAIADAGDSLDDANFDELVAESMILRLYVFERWIAEELKKLNIQDGVDFSLATEKDLWDRILENEVNYAIEWTTRSYNEMKFKQALKHGFFETQNLKEDYLIAKAGKVNPFFLLNYIQTQLILINPIAPHFADYCW